MDLAARWWPLAGLALLAVSVSVAGLVPRWPGLVHMVAVPPLDLAADLRVWVARAPSYPAFLVGAGISVVVRAAFLGALLATLGAVPTLGAGVLRGLGLYAAALVPLAVAAGVEFAGLASVYAWYAWAGIVLVLLVAIVVGPRTIPPGARLRRIPTLLGYLPALVVVGTLAELAGEWGAVIGIVASAALTAVVLDRLSRPAPQRRPGVAPAVGAVLALGLGSLSSPAAAPAPVDPGAVLLVVPGIDTSSGRGAAYRLDPVAMGFDCDRVFYFSYRGPGEGAPAGEAPCPIRLHRPYAQTSTQRPLGELVAVFAEQVEAIEMATDGAPMVVVTHSQGGAVAWAALAGGRVQGVSHLIALAGFPHSPVGYPPPGDDGPGRVGADALRVLSWLSRFVGVGTFDPDSPLARELLARPDGLEDVFAGPLPPEAAAATLFATLDLAVAPEGYEFPGTPAGVLDTTHAAMPRTGAAEEAIREVLAGRAPDGATLVAAIVGPAIPAWLPPPTEA